MPNFKSITAKYIFLNLLLLILIGLYAYAGFLFTQHQKGEARKINLAGRERMLTYSMAFHLQRAFELPSPDKEESIKKVRQAMAEYEEVLYALRDGSEDLLLKPVYGDDEESLFHLNYLVKIWEDSHKGTLLRLIESSAQRKAEVPTFLENIDRVEQLVKSLERHYDKEIKEFDLFRVNAIILFTIGAMIVFWLIKRNLIYPIIELNEAVKRFKSGNLLQRVKIKNRDEIGSLVDSFNSMASSIEASFNEQQRHIIDLWMLANTSNVLVGIPLEEKIYKAVCEVAVRDFQVKMVWIGKIEEGDYKVRPVAQSGFEEGYLSSINVTWDDSPTGMGPTGLSIKTRSPRIMNDMETDASFQPWREEALKRGYRSSMSLPMIFSNGSVFGAIMLYSDEPRFFSEEKVSLFQVFANQATTAIENRVLIDGLENKVMERTRELEEYGYRLHKLYDMSFGTKASAREFAGYVLSEISELLGVDGAAIGIVDEDKNEWKAYAVSDRKGLGLKEGMVFPLSEVYCAIVAREKKPLSINDAALSEEFRSHPDFVKYGFSSYLGVPVYIGDRLFGILCTFSKSPHNYTEYDLILHQLLSKRIEFEFIKEKYESELREAMMKASDASKAKSDFIANMSHELRTPLNTIIGYSTLLTEQFFGELNEKQQEFVNSIMESGDHLQSLINDVLDLSKVEAGRLNFTLSRFLLKDIIEKSMDMIREMAIRNKLTLAMDITRDADIELQGDKRKLKQILLNLLSNGVKFTPEGGSIFVRARLFRAGVVEITVEDTGIGIKHEDISRLFNEFVQLESPYTKKYRGTGLGLALTKRLVELHKGKIWIESEVGRGSKFIFTIPVIQSPYESSQL